MPKNINVAYSFKLIDIFSYNKNFVKNIFKLNYWL